MRVLKFLSLTVVTLYAILENIKYNTHKDVLLMANLRIISDNAIDRATLTASSTSGSLVIDNVKLDRKSKIYRAGNANITLTATWGTAELISGVVLPFCNLSANTIMRVRGYTNAADATPIIDTGNINPAPYIPLGLWSWGSLPLGVNAYSYGFNTYGRAWFNNTYSVKKLVIDILDSSPPTGFIEIGRMVAGLKWEPTYNTSFGIPVTLIDTSVHERTESGDLVTTIGPRSKQLSIDLSYMNYVDRQKFNVIMKQNGKSKPIFLSVFPEDPDTEKEQTYQIYGKQPDVAQMTHPMHFIYSAQLALEEI